MSISLGARAQAVLVLALVASLGALIGIIGDRMLAEPPPAPPPFERPGPDPRAGGGVPALRYAQQIGVLLDLTDEQRVRIDSILATQQGRALELSRQLRAATEDTRRQIEAVLTPEQREQLRALRQQRLRRLEGAPPPRRP